MTEEQIALAKRAVACKGWRWMPGMCFGEPIGSDVVMRRRVDTNKEPPPVGAIPILDDPATLGCLLAMVREAHGQTTLSPVSRGRRLWCLADFGTTALQGETEAEALVVALEAAP